MKKILFAALATVLLAGAATAQERQKQMPPMRDGQETREMRRNKMFKDLDLTKTQQKQLNALRATHIEQRNKIRADKSLTEQQKMQALEDLQKNMMEQHRAILTPGQRARLDERMQEYSVRGQKAPNNWQQLTPAQQAQVRDINELYNDKAKEIKDNTFLSKDAKQQQLRELQSQKRKAMDNILTPEQKQNMQNGNKEKRNNPDRRSNKNRPNLVS